MAPGSKNSYKTRLQNPDVLIKLRPLRWGTGSLDNTGVPQKHLTWAHLGLEHCNPEKQTTVNQGKHIHAISQTDKEEASM